jgi:putative transposase
MKKYNPNIHQRRSIRLKGYDYSQAGFYFITICCQDRAHFFGEIIDGEMILNDAGKIAFAEWMKTPEIRPNVELGEFVIMPNHMHGIIRILGRGESHSPEITNESHSPVITNESHSPVITNESHSPEIINESHSPEIINESHSPEIINESHSPEIINESHSPDNGNNFKIKQMSDNKGENISPLRSPSQTIGAIIRGYKSSVTKQLGLLGYTEKLWQRNYYEHIIRNDKSYKNILDYILNNPSKWNDDKFYTQ